MGYIKLFLVLTCLHCVFSGVTIKKKCNPNQTDYSDCLKELTQEFLRNYYMADPENDIKSTDPVAIPFIVKFREDIGMMAEFKNIKATGFKDVVVSNVKANPGKGHTELTMKFNLIAEGDIVITKAGKNYEGTFKYEGSIDGTTEYTYKQRQENNLIYFELAPEIVTCVANNTNGILNPELYAALEKDPEANAMKNKFQKIKTEYFGKVLCKVGTIVIKTAVDNMRTVAHKGVQAS